MMASADHKQSTGQRNRNNKFTNHYLPQNAAPDSYPLQGGFRSQLKQALRIFSGITLAENGVPRYQDFYSGAHGVGYRITGHASVNFDPEVGPACGAHGGP